MITIGDKQYRNLEEQVLKNQEDIRYLLEEGGTLNQFGIKVVGTVTSSDQLPNPTTYEGEYGDAFAVGTEAPFSFYIFTRAISGQPAPYWFALGEFPVPGPQGPQGESGERGETGATGPQGVPGIQGQTGPIGPAGPKGETGNIGPAGPQGPKGEPGQPFALAGILQNANQLPTPTADIRNYAYLIGTASPYALYMITGTDTLIWENVGEFMIIEGPPGETGPQGPQGETGLTGPQGETGLTGPQGVPGIQGVQGETGPKGDPGVIALRCNTAPTIQDKLISAPGFTLTAGAIVLVSFPQGNSANSPTLNINNTGATIIRDANGDSYYIKFKPGAQILMVYVPGSWIILAGYPLSEHHVGSVYVQFWGDYPPDELFGGTWEIIEEYAGRTIIGSGTTASGITYSLGDFGGSQNHIHSAGTPTDEDTTLHALIQYNYGSEGQTVINESEGNVQGNGWQPVHQLAITSESSYTGPARSGAVKVVGNVQAATTMQPYVVINYWRRTA